MSFSASTPIRVKLITNASIDELLANDGGIQGCNPAGCQTINITCLIADTECKKYRKKVRSVIEDSFQTSYQTSFSRQMHC